MQLFAIQRIDLGIILRDLGAGFIQLIQLVDRYPLPVGVGSPFVHVDAGVEPAIDIIFELDFILAEWLAPVSPALWDPAQPVGVESQLLGAWWEASWAAKSLAHREP